MATDNKAVVDVCNHALMLVGAPGTMSSIDDGTNEARACRVCWSATVESALHSADFTWAVGSQELEPAHFDQRTSGASWSNPDGHEYPFEAPAAMLRGLDVYDEFDDILPWKVGISPAGKNVIFVPADVISGPDAKLRMRYVRKPQPVEGSGDTDYARVEQWDGQFRLAFTYMLAASLGPALSLGSMEKMQALQETGGEILQASVASNSITGNQRPVPTNPIGRVKYQALERIGRAAPGSTDGASATQARVLHGALKSAREKLIRTGRFTFATRWFDDLVISDKKPNVSAEFITHAYEMPESDEPIIHIAAMYIRSTGETVQEIDWKIIPYEGEDLVLAETGISAYTSNVWKPSMQVLVDVEDLSKWPEFALNLLAWQLAADTLDSIAFMQDTPVGKMQLAREFVQGSYAQEFQRAAADDANAVGRLDLSTTKRTDRFTAAGYGMRRLR